MQGSTYKRRGISNRSNIKALIHRTPLEWSTLIHQANKRWPAVAIKVNSVLCFDYDVPAQLLKMNAADGKVLAEYKHYRETKAHRKSVMKALLFLGYDKAHARNTAYFVDPVDTWRHRTREKKRLATLRANAKLAREAMRDKRGAYKR